MVERTLVLVKPSGFARGLVGEVVSRLERRGLVIREARTLLVTREMATLHYGEHQSKPFFGELVDAITASPLFAMMVEGPEAITLVRGMMGATNPMNAAPGTVRGDYGLDVLNNVVHSSDGPESATRELGIFFPDAGAAKS